jgi:phage terminase large subunit
MTPATASIYSETYTPLPNDRVFNLIKAQSDFILSKARHPAYVSAWATGKTTAGIGKAMELSAAFPGNLGVIFRKEYTDLKDSTVKDFEEYTGLKVDSGRDVKLSNGSIVMFRHLEEMNNIQNINLGWFWIEQAEELVTDDQFFKLWGRLRRRGCDQKGFITANTNGHNWIYKLWKLKNLSGGELFEAKTLDNAGNLSPEFLNSLEILKDKKPNLYNRFVMNSWDEADSVDIIIKPEAISKAMGRDLNIDPPIRKVVSIDVSRYGDDKTVFYAIENNAEIDKEIHEKKSTMETVGLAVLFAKKHGIESFAVDEIGVGGGVADRLLELEKDVIFVNASERQGVRNDCFNRRAEIYLNGAELFESGRVSILKTDIELAEQLSWAKYKTIKSNGVFQVEPKEDIKKRFGRSPDEADAFLNGLWALPQVNPVKQEDKYERHFNRKREVVGSGMTV